MNAETYFLAMLVATIAPQSLVQGGPGDQIAKLLTTDGAVLDRFGDRVAISGQVALVGASWDDDYGPYSGGAYLFDATTGTQLHKLLPTDGAAGDLFGFAIAIDGNIALVSSPNDYGDGALSGSVYVFDVLTGQQIAKLVPDDAFVGDMPNDVDRFGETLAIEGGFAIIGAPYTDDNGLSSGSVYVFDVATWSQLRELHAEDARFNHVFGYSLALSGHTAIIGTGFDDEKGDYAGAAYLFDVSTGQQLVKIVADDAEPFDYFGSAVAISNQFAIIGAFSDADLGESAGSAYLIEVPSGIQLHKLLPNDGQSGYFFGFSVAINGDIAAAGTPYDFTTGWAAGSVYLFDVQKGKQVDKIIPDDSATGDLFGASIALTDSMLIAGAEGDDDNGDYSGSAYVFRTASTPCSIADLALPFGTLDFHDIAAFLDAFAARDPAADVVPPLGQFDFGDMLAYLSAFAAGCP
jgi:FG-GAP repeat protein